jgi:predicted nucleic acid-binding protein
VAVMERLKLRAVFAFDDDFRRLGLLLKPGKS